MWQAETWHTPCVLSLSLLYERLHYAPNFEEVEGAYWFRVVCLCMCPFVTLFDVCYILWTVHSRVLKLHGSKVSRESDLRSVPYNRPVGVRSFVKSVKSLRENQHNSWSIQDNLMKFHRSTQLVKMCVVGKNENSCSFRFLVICPLI